MGNITSPYLNVAIDTCCDGRAHWGDGETGMERGAEMREVSIHKVGARVGCPIKRGAESRKPQ